jgi:8-oxo-dGTP pyrophosphatase MutT (NUDIX family)
MRQATRLIIEEGDNIIFIKRTKKVSGSNKVFYVLPGGMLDEGETPEQAGIREAKEELSVDIELDGFLMKEYNEEVDKEEFYYFAKIVSGKVKPGDGEEFKNMDINSPYGLFEIVRISKKEIGAYDILPITIKDKLVATYV